jgi:hypothetical protein
VRRIAGRLFGRFVGERDEPEEHAAPGGQVVAGPHPLPHLPPRPVAAE